MIEVYTNEQRTEFAKGNTHGLKDVAEPLFSVRVIASHYQGELEATTTMETAAGKFAEETAAAEDKIKAARDSYNVLLKKWRSESGNDVESIKAQGQKVRGEMDRMSAAAQAAIALWTSPEMQAAIANAAAMAAALAAINELKQTNLTFCVLGKPTTPQENKP